MQMVQGLPPIIDRNCKILIFGSFPGEESLLQKRYYAKRNNDFWKLMGSVVGADLYNSGYEKKTSTLIASGIGLWDVFEECERVGSMDSGIRKSVPNDFSILRNMAPVLKLVCFNGKEAGAHESILQSYSYETLVLPSSSGANRRYSEIRLNQWLSLRDYLN